MNSRVSVPLACLLLLTAASLAFFIYFGQWFPPTMAVHFNAAGDPDGWMDRVKFIVIGTSMCFMLPPFLVACVGVLPRVLPVSMINLPNREYWLSSERREASLSRITYLALWLGCLVQAFLLAVFESVVRSNPVGGPAHLAGGAVVITLVFVAAIAVWALVLFRSFSAPE